MKYFNGWLTLLALAVPGRPARARGNEGIRNCIWWHGTSGQGYMVAPRLAGQRPQYIESQLRSFQDHSRDAPFAKQYIWGAAAMLQPDRARALADYFATIEPKPANDGNRAV